MPDQKPDPSPGLSKYVWPVIGLAAVTFSAWLLYGELRSMSAADLWSSIRAISLKDWVLAVLATLSAYAALAGYDHIALLHLRRHVDWRFVTLCSFTTYALSHNIGASVLSGSVVRYRAYSSRGLTGPEIGVLIGLCSFTFALGVVLLTGLVLIVEPELMDRMGDFLPLKASTLLGAVLVGAVALYAAGSFLRLRTLEIGRLKLEYPRPGVVARQLVIGPLELVSAAAILYFALPEAGNPGFLIVLGVFLVSFSAALLSHAPGGLGVIELVMVVGLPEMAPEDVIAALLLFRLLYLIIPFVCALVVVVAFERSRLVQRRQQPPRPLARS